MTQTYLEKYTPEKNQYRFYKLSITRNIFGYWSLDREWGRIGSRGQGKSQWFDDLPQAQKALDKLVRQKVKKGYILAA